MTLPENKCVLLSLGLGFSAGTALQVEAWSIPWAVAIIAAGTYSYFLLGALEEDADV